MVMSLQRRFARFLRDERGNLTVEFMLWLPVLVFWLILSLVLFDAYKSRNDASKAAYVIADLVSRESVLTEDRLDMLYALQDEMIPRADPDKGLRITNVKCERKDSTSPCDYQVLWSVKPSSVPSTVAGMDPITADEDLPEELFPPAMRDEEEMLLVEMHAPFSPLVDWVGIGANNWVFRIVTRTRYVVGLACDPNWSACPEEEVSG